MWADRVCCAVQCLPKKSSPAGLLLHDLWDALSAQRLDHGITHLRGADLGRAFAVDVGGAQALGQHRLDRRFNAVGGFGLRG